MTVTEDAQGRPQFITPEETEGLSWHHRPEVIVQGPARQRIVPREPRVPSAALGVTWDRDRACWRAYVGGGKSRHYIGRYGELLDAIEARNNFIASAGTSHPGSVGLKKIISGLELKPARANKTSAPRTQ